MSESEVLNLLRGEMQGLAKSVQELTVGLALVDQRMALTKELQESMRGLQETLNGMDRRLIKVSGLNGDNGQVSEISKRVEVTEKKLEGLLLSRAALVGYAGASAGLAGAAVKFLL